MCTSVSRWRCARVSVVTTRPLASDIERVCVRERAEQDFRTATKVVCALCSLSMDSLSRLFYPYYVHGVILERSADLANTSMGEVSRTTFCHSFSKFCVRRVHRVGQNKFVISLSHMAVVYLKEIICKTYGKKSRLN